MSIHTCGGVEGYLVWPWLIPGEDVLPQLDTGPISSWEGEWRYVIITSWDCTTFTNTAITTPLISLQCSLFSKLWTLLSLISLLLTLLLLPLHSLNCLLVNTPVSCLTTLLMARWRRLQHHVDETLSCWGVEKHALKCHSFTTYTKRFITPLTGITLFITGPTHFITLIWPVTLRVACNFISLRYDTAWPSSWHTI